MEPYTYSLGDLLELNLKMFYYKKTDKLNYDSSFMMNIR